MTVKSSIGQLGDQVTLLSPMKTFEKGTALSFYYHMWISDHDNTAALTVFTYSQLRVYEKRLIDIRGDHGTSWEKVSVCLPEGTYQLAFVATHGLQFLSDIAVDEIELHDDQKCSESANSSEVKNKGKYFTHTNYITVIQALLIKQISCIFDITTTPTSY